jgi:hypothetical protein
LWLKSFSFLFLAKKKVGSVEPSKLRRRTEAVGRCRHWEAVFGDGLLEVVSLRSSADVGLAAVGIKVEKFYSVLFFFQHFFPQPARVAQCNSIRMVLSKELPVQMDGEPFLQEPCTIEISLLNQVPVLVAVSTPAETERALDLVSFFEDEEQLKFL